MPRSTSAPKSRVSSGVRNRAARSPRARDSQVTAVVTAAMTKAPRADTATPRRAYPMESISVSKLQARENSMAAKKELKRSILHLLPAIL